MPVSESQLDERYGRKRMPAKRRALIITLSATFGALLVISWAIWAGVTGLGPSAGATELSHDIPSENQATITYTLAVTPGHPAACAIRAEDATHLVVGWKVIAYPAAEEATREVTETVLTDMPAVTVFVEKCWLT